MNKRNVSASRARMGRNNNVRQAGMSRSNFLRGVGLAGAGVATMGFSGVGSATKPMLDACETIIDPGFNVELYREGVLCGSKMVCATAPWVPLSPFAEAFPSDPGAYDDYTLLGLFEGPIQTYSYELYQGAKGFTLGVAFPHQTESWQITELEDVPTIGTLNPALSFLDFRATRFEVEVQDRILSKFYKLYMAGLVYAATSPDGTDLFFQTGATGMVEGVHYELFNMWPLLFPELPEPPGLSGLYPIYMPLPISTPADYDRLFAYFKSTPQPNPALENWWLLHDKVKLRGYFIQGDGVLDEGTGITHHPIVVFTPGITRAIADPENLYIATQIVANGYSLVMFDKRGHGFSEDPNLTVGEDVFEILDQLESGSNMIPPGQSVAAWGSLIPDVKNQETILMGISQGSIIMSKAMTKNFNIIGPYGWLSIDTEYTSDGEIISTGVPPKGYKFKAFIDLIGLSPSPYHLAPPLFFAFNGAGVKYYGGNATGNGNIYNTMINWPAHFMVRMTQDLSSAQGPVDAFNNKLRGYKSIYLLEGFHEDLLHFDEERGVFTYLDFVLDKSIKFMDRAIFTNPPNNQSAKTTFEKEICKAGKSSGRLDSSRLKLNNILMKWLSGLYSLLGK